MTEKRKAKRIDKLPDCKYVDLKDGVFRVFEDGTILRKKNSYYVEPPQYKFSRNGKYLAVSATIGGKQKHYYVHRLLGEAFIPNPDDKPHINHKDGNGRNNNIENLEWVTPSENTQHAYDTGLFYKPEHYFNCSECGEVFRTYAKHLICATCRDDERRLEEAVESRKRKISEIREEFKDIDINPLDELYNTQYKLIAIMRLSGITYQEIGDYLNVSREWVRQVLKRIIDVRFFYKKDPQSNAKAATSENPIVRARYFKGITMHDISHELDRSAPYYAKKEEKPELFTVHEASRICELLDLDFKDVFLVGSELNA